jgi:hypothetical protein
MFLSTYMLIRLPNMHCSSIGTMQIWKAHIYPDFSAGKSSEKVLIFRPSLCKIGVTAPLHCMPPSLLVYWLVAPLKWCTALETDPCNLKQLSASLLFFAHPFGCNKTEFSNKLNFVWNLYVWMGNCWRRSCDRGQSPVSQALAPSIPACKNQINFIHTNAVA